MALYGGGSSSMYAGWSGSRMIRDRRNYAPSFRSSSPGPPRPPDRGPLRPLSPSRPKPPPTVGRPSPTGAAPGQPDLIGQARAQAQAMLDPMLRYTTDLYNARAQAATAAIGRVTGQYSSALEPISGQTKAMFEEAKGPVSRAAQGINAQLTQQGQASASQEQAAAAAVKQPASAAAGGLDLAAEGKGAGGAAGAIGQAMIDALTTAQKAAMEYADKLPGFAQLQGEFETKKTLAALAAEMADQLAQTTAQAPTLFYQIYNDLQDRARSDKQFQMQIDEFNYRKQQDLLDRQAATAKQRASIVGPKAPTVQGRIAYWQNEAEARTKTDPRGWVWEATSTGVRPRKDPRTGRPIVDPAFAAAQAQGLIPKSKTVGGYIYNWDPVTQQWVKSGGPGPAPKAPPKPGAPHTKEVNGVTYQWDPKSKSWKPAKGLPKDKTPGDKTPDYGSAPRRTAPGVWVTRSGKKLGPKASQVWEKKWKRGETDGKGHVKPPKTSSSDSGYAWNP